MDVSAHTSAHMSAHMFAHMSQGRGWLGGDLIADGCVLPAYSVGPGESTERCYLGWATMGWTMMGQAMMGWTMMGQAMMGQAMMVGP